MCKALAPLGVEALLFLDNFLNSHPTLYKIFIVLTFQKRTIDCYCMGHQKLRIDKTCLNCNYVVENKYCSNCGQENVESKQSFHYLFTHFIEDFTHYDGGFWRTMNALLFKPAFLTKEYMYGRRKKYVPPVKLYIFISFVAFLLPALLPNFSEKENTDDFIQINRSDETKEGKDSYWNLGQEDYKSVQEMDSVQATRPESERITGLEYYFTKKMVIINQRYTSEEIKEKGIESFAHNLPKVLFLYLPFFAFTLWLFHGKKRWYYFEHGVFTLHYFSFILLTVACFAVISCLLSILPYSAHRNIRVLIVFLMMCWWFFYFFRSHRKYYEEKRWMSRLKGMVMFFINVFFIILFLMGGFLFSIINIH